MKLIMQTYNSDFACCPENKRPTTPAPTLEITMTSRKRAYFPYEFYTFELNTQITTYVYAIGPNATLKKENGNEQINQ